MSFLFGKSKKNQQSALPAASREITSSHGPGSSIPVANGGGQVPNRDAEKARGFSQTPTPGGSVNNSLDSLRAPMNTIPEQKTTRERSESDAYARNAVGPPRAAGDSPYPWSQRRLTFSMNGANPFPRYGAAVNAGASKDGIIYIMGGLIAGSTVKGDLWVVEAASPNMNTYPVQATGEGPGPRVGHASLLVGNAFIVFGGDTKMDEGDLLDDTLYLLNTSSKHWSRAMPAGPRPSGRYGHTLNLLGSKIFIFGGQVEGYFFNDLVAFDLNSLQSASSGWEVLIPNSGDATLPAGISPPARTNHTIITWQDKMYLFGGTDGVKWYNDVWMYDPRINAWTELDCIGYIPVPREGHAAALVNDTMYIYGGRTQDGADLGDLAAFRISSRRWYMFQNMGPSPSPRSGHSMTAYGRHIVVLAGEPSSSVSDRGELSLAYVLDTSKIRYPASDTAVTPQPQGVAGDRTQPTRKFSGDSGPTAGGAKGNGAVKAANAPVQQISPKTAEPAASSAIPAPGNSRLPRVAGNGAPSGPPPQQQPPPQPRSNSRSKTPTKADRSYGPPLDTSRAGSIDRDNLSPTSRDSPLSATPLQGRVQDGGVVEQQQTRPTKSPRDTKESIDSARSGTSISSRSGSRAHRQQHSSDSTDRGTPRPSVDNSTGISREVEHRLVDSGVGSSPALTQQNDELSKELEAARSRNAWLASELALARKAGYQPNPSNSPVLDERSDAISEKDRPLLEAFVRMRSELDKVRGSIDAQAISAANKIAEIEKQRDAAISEAAYAKAKLAAHGGSSGSQAGTPQPDGTRSAGSPEMDRVNDISRRLAASLAAEREIAAKYDALTIELESEKKAKQFNEETVEALQKRIAEHDSFRQRNTLEMEALRMELHEAQKSAREEAASAQEARAAQRLMAVDKREAESKLSKILEENKTHGSLLVSLREAVTASTDKAILLEGKLEEERRERSTIEQKLAQLRAEHEESITELEAATRRLRDAEELAEKNAAEARTHREAVLSGLGKVARDVDDEDDATDERVTILQQQVEAAQALVRKHQEFADQAAGKVRSAEERIAGLEAYQEQTTKECLQIRKQLQATMKEMQALQAEKAEIVLQYERHQLESNALEVQLRTLKNLLEERGVSAVDVRRSRALESPGSRFGTPELNRVRELEQQLEASLKAHEEMRVSFEQREEDVNKEYEAKIKALADDHQAAVKYLKGTEKMLTKMKQELDRYKSTTKKLEEELNTERQRSAEKAAEAAVPSTWESERESLRQEITALQEEIGTLQEQMKSSVAQLESKVATLQTELANAQQAREKAVSHAEEAASQAATHEAAVQKAHADMDALQRENVLLQERARDAESRVQLFLDQFENSVDSYRRQSQMTVSSVAPTITTVNGARHTRGHDSISGDSLYSQPDDRTDGGDSTPDASMSASQARNSMALDSLANELETLRNHWESTNKAYRLSDRFDFEKTPISDRDELSKSLDDWDVQRRPSTANEGETTPKQVTPTEKKAPSTTN